MNFLKHVMQQLDDQSLGLLGAVLGENESKVRDGVRSAVPKILDSMVSVTNTEEGRNMLWRELRDTDASVASSFSKQMYYKDSQALVANGHDQLEGLIGAEAKQLIQSVSRESDIGSTSAKRLVGAVTPLVFASVANHQQSKQLNQNELGDVIAQQKNHLSAWQRRSDQYFASATNDDDQNEPLFSSLPPGSAKAPLAATAVASASLGMHHFGNRDKDKNDKEDSASTAGATSLSSKENDKAYDSDNRGRSGAYGGQSKSRLEKANEKNLADTPGGVEVNEPTRGYDQRSYDRRQRDAIAAHPANSGFAANTPTNTPKNSGHPSRSVVAGSLAAAGAGAATVVATAISPAAKAKAEAEADAKNKIAGQTDYKSEYRTTTTDSANTTNQPYSETTNTYDSKNPVSGFAAAHPSTSGEVKKSENDAGLDANGKRLWTPDSANDQRDADGTLRYSDTDADTKNHDGWFRFHWLWWPVLVLGSLLALSFIITDPQGRTDQDQEPSVVATSEGESNSTDTTDASALAADTTEEPSADDTESTTDATAATGGSTALATDDNNPKDSGDASEESNSGILSSSIQITPSESDATAVANDSLNEPSPSLEIADPANEGDNGLASTPQNADSLMPGVTDETTTESSTSNPAANPNETIFRPGEPGAFGGLQNEVRMLIDPDTGQVTLIGDDADTAIVRKALVKLDGSVKGGEAAVTDSATESDGENDNSEIEGTIEGTISPELNEAVLELDADEQVEELLSAIETELEEVKDETQAKAVVESLSQHISGLEKVLADRAQWKDEIGILVDFQLEEGQKMIDLAKKNAFQSEAVKKTLKGKFKQLNKLMKTTSDSP